MADSACYIPPNSAFMVGDGAAGQSRALPPYSLKMGD